MRVYHHAATHVGKVREHNEDRYIADGALSLFAVADGMGGLAAGEVAAEIAVTELTRFTRATLGTHITDPKASFDRAFVQADAAIHDRANVQREYRGMGTTLTALHIRADVAGVPWALIGHAGDSRCYLLRAGQGRQVTTDHSLGRHILENCLGANRGSLTHVDVHVERLLSGDVLVLCTDGLNYGLPDVDAVVGAYRCSRWQGPEAFAAHLIGRALAAGGPDNVTVVVVEVA